MHVVLEEIDNNIACLIPDFNLDPIYVPLTSLPKSCKVGDVFIMKSGKNHSLSFEIDKNEREERLNQNRLKRERLLKKAKGKD